MRILLLGANGQVGTELQRSLPALGEVVPATRSGGLVAPDGSTLRCETADFDAPVSLARMIERIAPDIVVNAAAYTAVDRAEDDAPAAIRVNAEAPALVAAGCAARGALLVHYSTDYVFEGTATRPYREDDPTSPLGVYGASKLAGEHAIRASGARHLILRTAWVYAAHGKNFLLTMLRLAAERDELRVVADQVGTPTSAALIADATAGLLARDHVIEGVHHLTASGSTTWHGFASRIVERAAARGLVARRPAVVAIASTEFPTRAERPRYSVLDCSVLREQVGIELPDWSNGLDKVLAGIAT